uniref:Ig-like domain-containing protein n=1 Tax=Glossina brevipalpis TaxID=37001 RepID=A0A1A9W9Q4_9MUSC
MNGFISSNTKFWYTACILLLTLLANKSTHAQRTPTISYISQEQIKDIGGTVEFECSVQYAKDYSVQWTKTDGEPVFLSSGSTLVIRDSRFALRYEPSASTYRLQIKDIQETDAGTYTCQVVISVVNKVSANVKLSVRRPPVISDNSTQSLVASEGSEVQMECYASGYPTPTVTWRRENNAILPTDECCFTADRTLEFQSLLLVSLNNKISKIAYSYSRKLKLSTCALNQVPRTLMGKNFIIEIFANLSVQIGDEITIIAQFCLDFRPQQSMVVLKILVSSELLTLHSLNVKFEEAV